MLRGKIRYKNLVYDVIGKDSSAVCRLQLSSNNFKAIMNMVSDVYSSETDGTELWERVIDIKMHHIVVQTHISKNDAGKKVKSPVNADFFCRLGALIRYVKLHCTTRNMVGYLGLQLASGDFTPDATTSYTVPFEVSDNTLAEVDLTYGDFSKLHIKTEDFEVDIEVDVMNEDVIIPQPKDGQKIGFNFDRETLGFELKPQVLEDTTTFVGGIYTSLEQIMQAHPDKAFSWLLNKDYHIVDDEHLQQVCDYIFDYDDYVYYDTETTGLRITYRSRYGQDDQCVGIILSVKDGESFFFPMQMKTIPNLCDGDHFYFMEHYIRRILEQKSIVVHNLAFDWKVGYIYDINANIVDDTMLMITVSLGQEYATIPVGVKPLTQMFLHRDAIELDDIVVDNEWDNGDIKFWDLPYELVKLYACADTDDTRGVHRYILDTGLLSKYNAKKVYEIELNFAYAVAYQEFYGHHQDINNIESLKEEVNRGIHEYYEKMKALVGHEFNPKSPQQLVQIMYHELGIPEQIDRSSGRVTTNKDAMKYLGKLENIDGTPRYPFAKYMLKYREYEGVRKIIDNFPEVSTPDGFLFSKVRQTGAATGRVSISEPNYQSYNDPVKKNIIPRPGYYMCDTDYSSVEYRVLANMAGNERIKQAFYDPDFDYHTYQAAHLYNVPYASVTKSLRGTAKSFNFGIPYGMGDESLGVGIFGVASEENTKKAAQLKRAYFKGQEDIEQFFLHHRELGVRNNYTETYFGRRRYYDRTRFSIGSIKRQAGNAVIQGTAADIYKLAVGRVFKRICREGWLGKVLFPGFIHDELLLEVSVDIDPMVFLRVLREEFEVKIVDDNGNPWCPLYMGFGWGTSWYQAKKTEVPIQMQWDLVNKYGTTGYPLWDGDVKKFCDSIPDMIRSFNIQNSYDELIDEKAQGKEIKPALNSMILDILKEDKPLYDKHFQDHDSIDDDSFKIMHIRNPHLDDEGNIVRELPKTDDTQVAISLFCEIHGFDRSKVNVLSIKEEVAGQIGGDEDLGEIDDYDNGENTEEMLQNAINSRISVLGMYVDNDKKEIICKLVPSNYMSFIKERTSPVESGGYKLYFLDLENNMKYVTDREILPQSIGILQQMYVAYFNSIRKGG